MGLPLPDWWSEKAERKRQNAQSRKQERDHAKATGGKQQPGSGSSYRAPGDVRGRDTLDELKYTQRGSYSIKLAEWRDVRRKALLLGREPRMIVEFLDTGVVLEIRQWEGDEVPPQ